MISEKELYDIGKCPKSCDDCPFYKTYSEKKYRDKIFTMSDCYSSFKDHYEKKEVIDYVLKGEE